MSIGMTAYFALTSFANWPHAGYCESQVPNIMVLRWIKMFELDEISGRAAIYLSYVDPQSESEFTSAGDATLDENLQELRSLDLSDYFRLSADPGNNDVALTGYLFAPLDPKLDVWYSKRPRPAGSDLLLSEWENRNYRFRMQESSRGLLLRIRPKHREIRPGKPVPARIVTLTLLDCLEIAPKDGNLAKEFGMPDPVLPGRLFVAPPKYPKDYRELGAETYALNPIVWEETLVVFLSGGDICVAITTVPYLKQWSGMFYSPNWLRQLLRNKDGEPVEKPVELKKPPGSVFGGGE